jgi:hypothetical protein
MSASIFWQITNPKHGKHLPVDLPSSFIEMIGKTFGIDDSSTNIRPIPEHIGLLKGMKIALTQQSGQGNVKALEILIDALEGMDPDEYVELWWEW